jgi:Kef-type K+ transport system membrane component KefB
VIVTGIRVVDTDYGSGTSTAERREQHRGAASAQQWIAEAKDTELSTTTGFPASRGLFSMADLSVFLTVGVALIAALALGELADRAGEPVILGEILAGILLGTHVLGVIGATESFALLAAIGSMLLLFDVGYEELDLTELKHGGLAVVLVVLFGAGLPAVTGAATGLLFGYSRAASTILAIALGVTSIGITARVFLDLDRLDTRYGHHVVGAAVTTEIIGLVTFSLLLATKQSGGVLMRGVRVLGPVVVFFAGVFVVQRFVIGRVSSLFARFRQPNADLLGIMGMLFLFGFAADTVRLDVVIGGLITGLIVGGERRFREIEIRDGITGIAYGVFIPLFFVNVGTQMDPSVLFHADPFVTAVVTGGVATKLGGGYIGARLAGYASEDALVVGVGMLPRAGVELVVITGALGAGVIDERVYSAVLALVLVSVLATPPLLKRTIGRSERSESPHE